MLRNFKPTFVRSAPTSTTRFGNRTIFSSKTVFTDPKDKKPPQKPQASQPPQKPPQASQPTQKPPQASQPPQKPPQASQPPQKPPQASQPPQKPVLASATFFENSEPYEVPFEFERVKMTSEELLEKIRKDLYEKHPAEVLSQYYNKIPEHIDLNKTPPIPEEFKNLKVPEGAPEFSFPSLRDEEAMEIFDKVLSTLQSGEEKKFHLNLITFIRLAVTDVQILFPSAMKHEDVPTFLRDSLTRANFHPSAISFILSAYEFGGIMATLSLTEDFEMYIRHTQGAPTILTVPRPLSRREQNQIEDLLLSHLEGATKVQIKVDPGIVSGFTLLHGEDLYDRSGRRALDAFKKSVDRLTEEALEPLRQSGIHNFKKFEKIF